MSEQEYTDCEAKAGPEDGVGCTDGTEEEHTPVRQAPEEELTEVGYLTVSAGTANRAYPLRDVRAEILLPEDGAYRLYRVVFTKEDGTAERIPLPTPAASLSQAPDSRFLPYTRARVRIYRDGYYPAEAAEVPVFPGITSLQYFDLIPLAEGDAFRDSPGDPIVTSEAEENPL